MAHPRSRTAKADADAPTRDRIRSIAADLYVLRGHDGFSFGDIAAAIGTTRANIHHHFGNKRQLMAELIDSFVADAETRIAAHWSAPGKTFAGRLAANVADLRRFYARFNGKAGARNVWSPISRIRLDFPVLGDLAQRALERVGAAYDASIRRAVDDAIAAGELCAGTPAADVSRLVRATLLTCAPMTQDSGSFLEVERVLAALGRTIVAAWGAEAGRAGRARTALRRVRKRPRRRD